MINMEKICDCNSEVLRKDFFSKTVFYCLECGRYKTIDKECEHELIPVLMKLSNDSFQLRLVCKNCFYIDPKPKKQSEYKGEIPKKDFENFKKYVESLEAPHYEFIKGLGLKDDSFRQVYEEYMKSPEWFSLRETVLIRDSYTCQICFNKAEEVHHLTYKHFKKEYLFELISLCKTCHKTEYHV